MFDYTTALFVFRWQTESRMTPEICKLYVLKIQLENLIKYQNTGIILKVYIAKVDLFLMKTISSWYFRENWLLKRLKS